MVCFGSLSFDKLKFWKILVLIKNEFVINYLCLDFSFLCVQEMAHGSPYIGKGEMREGNGKEKGVKYVVRV